MNRLICLFLLTIWGLLPGGHAQAESIALQRATVTSSDLDASIAFYTEVLGFTLRSNTAYDTPALRSMFHIPDGTEPRLAILDAGEAQPRALALVYAHGITVDAKANRQHAPALVLTTDDIDAVMERAHDAGVEIALPATPLADFQGKPFGREAMLMDPDGVRVVVFQYD